MYCAYCGRVQHRCTCAQPDSRARQFLARRPAEYQPQHMPQPYKRGVPPQIKRRERNTLRRHYHDWLAALTAQYGARCQNCGDDTSLVLDHVLPIAKGGRSELENLQILCAVCNRIKGKLWLDCR